MSGLKFSRPLIAFIALDTGFSKAFLLCSSFKQAGWATTSPVRVFFRLTFHRRYFWLFDNKKEIFEGTFELSQHLLSPALSRPN